MIIDRTRIPMVDKLYALGVIVGVAYLISGVIMVNDTTALISRGVKTTGAITEYHNVGVFHYPVVEFKDGAGSTVSAQIIDATKPTYRYMDKIPIIYDPANPTENVRLDTFYVALARANAPDRRRGVRRDPEPGASLACAPCSTPASGEGPRRQR